MNISDDEERRRRRKRKRSSHGGTDGINLRNNIYESSDATRGSSSTTTTTTTSVASSAYTDEFVSSDYNEGGGGYLWRLPTKRESTIRRSWLLRDESKRGYNGFKMYVPQPGDNVVYIPGVHNQLIANLPGWKRPWESWPEDTAWPVVRCKVDGTRFRFPCNFQEHLT